ncbi:MAG TPA: AAA family ATPase, partial [Polyangiaceae bacterium]
MVVINQHCTICQNEFELHFRYQMEERSERDETGATRTRYSFYCSQKCLEASHRGRADGAVACDACATRFEVELASQVLFTGGRRHYACSAECRTRILSGVRAVRLGQLLDPSYRVENDEQVSEPVPSNDAATLTPAPVAAETAPEFATVTALRSQPAPPQTAANEPETARPRSSSEPRVLAVFNHKGGTGKTTTAVHVAAGLAARGARVLLVDADGQGNVAASLGLEAERSLYHVLVMGLPFEQAKISARPNLDVIAANETLAAAELYIAGQRNRDRVMASRLGRAR